MVTLASIPGFLKSPATSQTYFPAEERKSRFRIYLDNFLWTIRHAEINECYFVYGLDRKHGSKGEQYISCREGMNLIRKANSQAWTGARATDYRCLCKDKFVFGEYLAALSFPTPKNLAIYDGSRLLWLDHGDTMGFESLLDVDQMDIFCKDALGAHGCNVFSLKVDKGRIYIDGMESTLDELRKNMQVPSLLQERLTQHPKMAEIYPGSINTLRLVTVLSEGEIAPFGAFVKFGTKGRRVDNWASGGLAVGVNLETGKLLSTGVYRPGKGGFAVSHPESGIHFEGFEIPFFRKAVEQATRLHRFFYGLVSIGWDIAITPKGPVFIEGNHGWEIWAMQAIVGGLKSELRRAIPLPHP